LTGVALAATWEPLVARAAEPAERIAAVAADKRGAAIFSSLGPTDPHLVGANFSLDLDTFDAGALIGLAGGRVTSDVITEKLGPDRIQHKHLGGVKYEEITLQTGLGMSPKFFQWVTDTINFKFTRQHGAIVGADFNHKQSSRLEFFNALISEIGFPALDAASKDAAKMTIKIAPAFTRPNKISGAASAPAGNLQKKWLAADFNLKIDGLDATGVSKIDPIVVNVKFGENPTGELRDFERQPITVSLSNLKITLAASHAQTWLDWHEAFVIKGNNARNKDRNGSLSWLSPDLKTELGRIELFQLGIFGIGTEPGTGHVVAELFVERLNFKLGGALT
jgi:phage tail-like protein